MTEPSTHVDKNWWRGGVIYQIYPRSFYDTTGNGVGDINGITEKLGHIASLGVDAIWISPFMKSPMKDFGYDVADYKSVDPVFGNLDDFKNLISRAHALNLKVMIDMVWSHSSDQHDWFKESATSRDNSKADWYVWADPKPDGTPPNNWLSYFGGPAWTWSAKRGQYYLHHFLKEQPSLNLWNDDLRAAIRDTADFWLDMGVDGFRLDVAHAYLYDKDLRDNPVRAPEDPFPSDIPASNPMSFQKRIYSMCTAENIQMLEHIRQHTDKYEARCLLGEAGGDDSEAVAISYVQDGGLHFAYTFALLGSSMQKNDVASVIERVEQKIGKGWLCWSTSNHDFARPVTRMNPPKGLEKEAALLNMALALSLRGSYCMFQGEELGLPQAQLSLEELQDPYDIMLYPEHAGRDGSRTPIPWEATEKNAGFSKADKTWLPVKSDHVTLSVSLQDKDENSVLNHYRDFIHYRKESRLLKEGDIKLLETHSDILIFERSHDSERLICIYNISASPDSIELTSIDRTNTSLISEISHGAALDNFHLSLSPYGYAFLKDKS